MARVCDCNVENRTEQIIKRARIPKLYENCDFESYVTDLEDGDKYNSAQILSLKQAKVIAQKFSLEYPVATDAGLLFMGNSGVGKTHLAVAILRELLKRGFLGYFCDYGKLLKQIKESYSPESEVTELSLLNPIVNVEVLVIDSLGEIEPSSWILDIVGYILNERYVGDSRDLSHRRCTILTTNFLDEVDDGFKNQVRLPNGRLIAHRDKTLAERIGARMRSRLYEMCRTVELSAPDFRREVRQAGRARA